MENRLNSRERVLLVLSVIVFVASIVSIFFFNPVITAELVTVQSVLSLIFALSGTRDISLPERIALNRLAEPLENANRELAEIRRNNSDLMKQVELLNEEIAGLNEKAAALEHENNTLSSLMAKPGVPTVERQPLFNADLLKTEESVNIKTIIEDSIEQLKEFLALANINASVISTEENINTVANGELLTIMFKNILDNSVKYMQRPGRIIITLSDMNDEIFIVCKDNGMGLSDTELPYIFDINYQGSNRVSGNGLGLTQAKDIVTAYGGMIYAKSTYNEGLAVYIQLPKRVSNTVEAPKESVS